MADSPFNSVNYNGDRMSVHVRTAETSNPDFTYFYDSIFILDSKGTIVGHFWFREMATYISGQVIGFFKHWKYFRFFFNFVEQVYVTQKRLVIVFPTTSPLGLRVISTSQYVWEIHPEYLPENKIKSAVIAYNFNADNNYSGDAEYKVTDNMFDGRDMFWYENDSDIGSWNHVMGFKTLRNFQRMKFDEEGGKPVYLNEKIRHLVTCFEDILSLPDSLIDMTGIAQETIMDGEENPYGVALPPQKTFNNLMSSRGSSNLTATMTMMGFWFGPKLQPTMTYVGSDSSIIAVNLKTNRIDELLDSQLELNTGIRAALENYPDTANAIKVIQTLMDSLVPDKTTSFSKFATNLFDVFVRVGPHCYLYTTPYGIVYPVIEYTEQHYFFNDRKIASGDLPYIGGQILNLYDKKFLKMGRHLYNDFGGVPTMTEPYNPESFYTRERQELVDFKYFDESYYPTKYLSKDFFIAKEDGKYVFMADWLNKRYIQEETSLVKPIVTFGDKLLIGVSKQGSLTSFATFYSLRNGLTLSEKEKDGEDIIKAELDISDFYFFKNFKREILALEPAYRGFFVETSDGNETEWFFTNISGLKVTIKDIYNVAPENWKVINIDDLDCNEKDGWCKFNDFLIEDTQGKTTALNLKLDGIKVIGGEII